MEKILEVILESLENGNWLLLVAAFSVVFIFKIGAIISFFEERRGRQEKLLKDFLDIDMVKGASRFYAEDRLNAIVFKRATGIMAERSLRDKIHELHEASGGELLMSQLSSSRRYLALRDGKLLVNISWVDRVEGFFNGAMALFMVFFALLIFILPSVVGGVTVYQFIVMIGMSLLLFSFCFFLVSQIVPLSTAVKIKPIIERLEEGKAPSVK